MSLRAYTASLLTTAVSGTADPKLTALTPQPSDPPTRDVLVRGVPATVHAALVVRAKGQGMSLRAYTASLLTAMLSAPDQPAPPAIPPELLAVPGVLAELLGIVKRIEARLSAPVGEDAAENGRPQPPDPEPEAVAPVGEASPVAEPEPEDRLYVVERWIAEGWNGWSAKLAHAILASLDAMRDLSDADLTVWVTETLHKPRSDFDAVVGRYLAAWLEARGEPAPVDETSARWARLAFAAELRAVLAKLEEVDVLLGT